MLLRLNLTSLQHLHHLVTLLGAGAARLGASGHLFVAGNLLAGGSTLLTTFGATLRSRRGEVALAGAQRRAQLAAIRAVHAEVHALGMFLFSLPHERRAMMEARVAHNLAVSAGCCALQHHDGVRVVFRFLGGDRGHADDEEGESQSHRTQRDRSVIHGHRLSLQTFSDPSRKQHASVLHRPFRARDSFGPFSRAVGSSTRSLADSIGTPHTFRSIEARDHLVRLLCQCLS